MYTLYLDKPEEFVCELQVKNASLKNAFARMIVKSDNLVLLFEGKIENGKCIIPISRLKGLLEENTRGKMNLEVVVEDSYFSPWHDDFLIEEHTSVKVRVNEQKQSSNKPIVKIKPPILKFVEGKSSDVLNPIKKKGVNIFIPKKEIATICEQFGIRKNNFQKKQKDFIQILKEYFKVNAEYNYYIRTILSGIDDFLR